MDTIIVVWVFYSFIAAYVADARGHNPLLIFVISIFFSPIAGLVVCLGKPINQLRLDMKGVESGRLKECHYCKEYIKSDAIKCKHCNENNYH